MTEIKNDLKIELKHVEGSTKETRYIMEVETKLNQYKIKHLKHVERSYKEFLKLYNYLTGSYTDVLVPVLPPGINVTSRIHKLDMQAFATRLSEHKVIKKDLELQTFLESKFIYSPAPIQLHKLSVNYQGYRYEDDNVYGRTRANLMAMELIIKEVNFVHASLIKQQNQIAQALLDMAAKTISLGVTWIHLGVNNPEDSFILTKYRKLGKIIQLDSEGCFQLLEEDNLTSYFELLTDAILYLMDSLMHRFNVMLELEQAKLKKDKKEQGLVVLKKQVYLNQPKVDNAIDEFEMAKKYEEFRAGQMSRLNQNLPQEIEIFENNRYEDGKRHLKHYAKLHLEHHKKMLLNYQNIMDTLNDSNSKLDSNINFNSLSPLHRDAASLLAST